MILRSVGIAGAIVVGLAVAAALTLLPAILAILGTRIDRWRVRRVAVEPGADGPWARLARRVMRHPVAVLVPTLVAAAAPRAAVPPRPVQRPGRDDPAAVGPVARGVRRPRPRVRRGRVRAARASRSGRPAPRRARRTSPRSTTTRAASPPTRASAASQPRRRRPAADARAVPAALRARRPARRTGSSRPRSARPRRAT